MDMLLDISPDLYGLYLTMDRKGIKQLITQCMNVIYGTMVEILLNYCKFFKMLKLDKFKMNPYDPCAANILVNVLQKSILFRDDGFKLRHKVPKLNDSLIGVPRE